MTIKALVLYNLVIEWPYDDGVRNNIESEGNHVLDAINSLDGIFFQKRVRGMAVYAACNIFVAGMAPAFVGVHHNVAISAGPRVAAQIGVALSINKSENAQAKDSPGHASQQNQRPERSGF